MTDVARVFCWLPRKVWCGPFWQDGCVWLGYAYLGANGRLYRHRMYASTYGKCSIAGGAL